MVSEKPVKMRRVQSDRELGDHVTEGLTTQKEHLNSELTVPEVLPLEIFSSGVLRVLKASQSSGSPS